MLNDEKRLENQDDLGSDLFLEFNTHSMQILISEPY